MSRQLKRLEVDRLAVDLEEAVGKVAEIIERLRPLALTNVNTMLVFSVSSASIFPNANVTAAGERAIVCEDLESLAVLLREQIAALGEPASLDGPLRVEYRRRLFIGDEEGKEKVLG